MLPAWALILWSAAEHRRTVTEQTQDNALALARQIANEQHGLVEGAHQLLMAVAQIPGVRERDGRACGAVFAQLLTRFPVYTNLGVATREGDVFCTGLPSTGRLSIVDRAYFAGAVRTRGFAIGDYQLGRLTGRPTIGFGYPVLDARGEVEGVVFAALDLQWLAKRLGDVSLPEGSTLTLVDRHGTILIRSPEGGRWAGQPYAGTPIAQAVQAQREGIAEGVDLDGRSRFAAFTVLGSKADADPPRLVIGIPTEVALAPVHRLLTRNLVSLAVVGLLALGTAWVAGEAFVLRRVRTMMAATQRLGAGDLGARIGAPPGGSELDTLARAFDEMADGIERLTGQNRLILDSAGDGIYGVDLNGRVTFVNPAAAVVSGYTAAELLGQPMHRLLHHTRADGSPYPSELCPTAETLRRGVTRNAYDDVFWRKDGTSFPVEYVSTPVRRGGRIEGAVVTFKDITERKRIAAELERQREALHQTEKVATMGSLLAGVAHELNNPLAVVMGMSLLLRQATTEPVLVTKAEKIHAAAERCARIVKNFLALARQRPPERGEVQLNTIAREAVELLAYELRTDNVEVVFDLAEDVPALWADAHQLHQVVVNLIGNAHHAMRRNEPPRWITLRTRVDADHARVRLEIVDTGPGIPPDILIKIFEPFFTTKPPGQGTGLGLSLCRNIVTEHHGTLTVDSELGRGAAFILDLPVIARPAGERGSDVAEDLPALTPQTILVVDDEPDVAAVVAETLKGDGHRVLVAFDGAKALEMLRHGRCDLVISDTKMPTLGGAQFHAELTRRHPDLRHRIIFLTGDVLDPDKQKFLEQTHAPVLTKPFDLTELRRLVRRTLGGPAQSSSS